MEKKFRVKFADGGTEEFTLAEAIDALYWYGKAVEARQKVGLDKNGEEVYEGDRVKNPVDGTTFRAAMNHIYTVKNYVLGQCLK